MALGLDEFIVSGWPHLEEALRVGDFVIPHLADLTAADTTGVAAA
ncbi:hypothetical protein Pth03_22280 [Planotetraspora thailandica]|uniref:Uncharacterized protein n=1 Tax=Planotetraspora thailandica TaxID=487172 RepID=A0A8J3XV19_9ACTN|nr:hypothetical protein [Planotetraspora thailandica]GII53839.1 hypothetical protein Pth03_22280 [Planotetraspora thailandica]